MTHFGTTQKGEDVAQVTLAAGDISESPHIRRDRPGCRLIAVWRMA